MIGFGSMRVKGTKVNVGPKNVYLSPIKIDNMRFLPWALLLSFGLVSAQEASKTGKFSIGLAYGLGNEFKNTDYTYTNRYFQAQLYYTFNPGKKWQYQMAVMPEFNLATHQLKNIYFVTPEEADYEHKREEYSKLKDIREYVLNVAFLFRRQFSQNFSLYAMGNIGPMITDTETERLTKGFAFCDVFALGAAYTVGGVTLDLRPNVRHCSNAGLQSENAGFNTYNVTFGVVVPL